MRFFLLRYVVLPASRGGKLKTVLQSVAIGLYLLPLDVLPDVGHGGRRGFMVAAALVVTVVTGVDYVRAALRIQPRREPAAARGRLTRSDGDRRGRCSPTCGARGWTRRRRRVAHRRPAVARRSSTCPGASAVPARRRRRLRHRPQGRRCSASTTALLAARGAVDPDVARADGRRRPRPAGRRRRARDDRRRRTRPAGRAPARHGARRGRDARRRARALARSCRATARPCARRAVDGGARAGARDRPADQG